MIPHSDIFICNNNLCISKIENIINIAFIGNFIEYKGSELFKYLFNNLKFYNGKLIKYHIFGYISDIEKLNKINDENFIYHNTYDNTKIIDILYKNKIHIITHLSLFEESYCYALTNSINSGIPILYINHGALTERLDNNSRYFPRSVNDLIVNYQKILRYIDLNHNIKKIANKNNILQPNKWYLLNY